MENNEMDKTVSQKNANSTIPILQYPDVCAMCNVDACSMCGHLQKRISASNRYETEMVAYQKTMGVVE